MATIDAQRRQALVWSGTLAGVVVVAVVTVAAATGSTFLGFGMDSSPAAAGTRGTSHRVVTQFDDKYVVVTRPAAKGGGGSRTAAVTDSNGGGAAAGGSGGSASSATTTTTKPPTTPSTTPPTTPPTTRPPVTTPTTFPPGTVLYVADLPPGWEVPAGWPANKPLPPLPANCVLGHLEDNLVWNCEH